MSGLFQKGTLPADLADAGTPGNGAGRVGFGYALAYVAGTLGKWVNDLALATGAGFIGWMQIGAGAVTRTLRDKAREWVSVDDFGAIGDGIADDSAAIIAAQAALVARGGGTVFYTLGKTYRLIAASIPHANGITHEGTGKTTTDSNGASMGARIVSATRDLFVNVGAINAGLTFRNLWVESQVGGGHIFAWSGTGLVAKVEIYGCLLFQRNPAKSVISGTSANGVFSLWARNFEFSYMVANTVPAIDIRSNTVNSIVIENYWSICSSGATSGTYAIWIESTNAAGQAFNVSIRQGVFEVPGGGAINLLSCSNATVEDCATYDLLVAPSRPMFRIGKGATGPASNNSSLRRLRSLTGTAANPDVQIDLSIAGQAQFLVEQCSLTWLDQVTANGSGVLHVSNSITNYENCAFTELSASQGLDLRWIGQAAGAHTYSIWNGFPGSANGYLNFSQDGIAVGGISPTGLLQWGGTQVAPKFYVGQSGLLNTANKIYPGTPANVDQAAAGIYAGAGVPNNAQGLNGDYYFRGDTPGTANQRIYVKSAGIWSGIA